MADAACGSWMIFYCLTPSHYDGDVTDPAVIFGGTLNWFALQSCSEAFEAGFDCCRKNVDVSTQTTTTQPDRWGNCQVWRVKISLNSLSDRRDGANSIIPTVKIAAAVLVPQRRRLLQVFYVVNLNKQGYYCRESGPL